MAALNIIPPEHYLGAVESIPLVTELIGELQQRDAIYPVPGEYPDLYFRVGTDADFFSLSHLDPAAAREVFAERGGDPDRAGKEDPLDCLVWRAERDG